MSGAAPVIEYTNEPFGQLGIRQYVWPGLVVIALLIGCGSAYMWYRSYDLSDGWQRSDAESVWWVRSIYGRVVVTRSDFFRPDAASGSSGWNYTCQMVPDDLTDRWAPSWKKSLGVEWQNQALFNPQLAVGGWWLRVRWRTITLIALALPLWTVFRHHSSEARARLKARAQAQERSKTTSPETVTR